jgi:hypothetical protein
MNNDTCPHCGAEKVDDADRGDYSCDTFHYHDGSIVRGYICYDRQIAAQAAEIERLRKELSRIYVHSGDGTSGECEYCNWSSDTAFNALKEVK